MVVILWRLRLDANLNPKVKISFVKKQNKKVSAHKKR